MKEHKYVPITLGWTVKRNTGELQGNVSYRNITAENTVHDPEDYTIVHTITIENNTVFLNGKYIIGAPAGKTKAFKEKFCKAVVWSLLNDDQGLKDKLKETSEKSPIKSLIPLFPAGYLPYLNVTITEECVA